MLDGIRCQLPWLRVGALALMVVSLPAFIGQGSLTRRKFDPGPRETLARQQPPALLIGDSMLDTRIDEKLLRRISGSHWEKMAWPGSGSAVWHLILKNHVAPQVQPPRVVVIFFRDMQLTLADYHTQGRYRPRLEALMEGPEMELESTLQTLQGNPVETLAGFSLKLFPLQSHQLEWQEKIHTKALVLTTAPARRSAVKKEVDRIFSARYLREDAGVFAEGDDGGMTGLNPSDHVFEEALPQSLLPAMLQVSARRNIRLVFFCVKRCPPPGKDVASEPAYLTTYHTLLQAYLQQAGAILLDETWDTAIDRSFYNNDDHVREAKMPAYTSHFWQKYGPLLPVEASSSAPAP